MNHSSLTGVGYKTVMYLINALYFLDIVVCFRTTTFDIHSGEEVLEPKKIAKNYVTSIKFWIDVLSFIPFDECGVGRAF